MAMKGIGLALRHATETRIVGRTRQGRRDQATLRVVDPEAFLVLKGLALLGRREPKDAYDIHYLIRNFEEGAEALGRRCRLLLDDPDARRAYREIALKFAETDSYGPGAVLDFLRGGQTPDEALLLDAQRQVQAWLRGVGEADLLREP